MQARINGVCVGRLQPNGTVQYDFTLNLNYGGTMRPILASDAPCFESVLANTFGLRLEEAKAAVAQLEQKGYVAIAAGVSIEQAEILGVPVDAGRIGSHGNNVMALREFVRTTRSRF